MWCACRLSASPECTESSDADALGLLSVGVSEGPSSVAEDVGPSSDVEAVGPSSDAEAEGPSSDIGSASSESEDGSGVSDAAWVGRARYVDALWLELSSTLAALVSAQDTNDSLYFFEGPCDGLECAVSAEEYQVACPVDPGSRRQDVSVTDADSAVASAWLHDERVTCF